MSPEQSFGDLVVVIPGILGSRLVRREGTRSKTVWDFSLTSLPRVLKQLATGALVLDRYDGAPDDGVEATDLFSFQWLPDFFGVDDYEPLLKSLRASIAGKPQQLITFPYDWRASNRYAAQRLHERALSALAEWKKTSGNTEAKLWLVCHSMGGLVARYFCEHLDGAQHTRAIVTIGTPHRGSVKALDALANGKGVWPLNLTHFVRSMPSVYELLPLFPAIRIDSEQGFGLHRVADFFGLDPVSGKDRAAANGSGAGLPALQGLDYGMLKSALEFHACIRMPAEARAAEKVPSPYEQYVFFNRRQRTPLSAQLKRQKLEILQYYPKAHDSWTDDRGDGTVPSFAAIPIEWPNSKDAIPIGDKHPTMQCAKTVWDSVENWLRPLDTRKFKGGVADTSIVELDVPPALSAGDDLRVELSSLQPMNVTIQVQDAEGRESGRLPAALSGDDNRKIVTFRRPGPGVHRVSAIPADRMLTTVSDFVLVPEPD